MRARITNIILGNGKDIQRKTILWNMLFSIMSALQSAIMIMLVTRACGTEIAGILSIAYASAYLMFTVGSYGVRNFQATDSRNLYSYNDYRNIRILSCILMVISSVFYCHIKQYYGFKLLIIIIVCILKLEEVVEDLYHGEFQRVGRLDIAGRIGVIRLIISYIIFSVALCVFNNLVLSLLLVIIFTLIIVFITRIILKDFAVETKSINNHTNFFRLLVSCFPLFVMSFLSIYISNAPKYAIDSYLSEEKQAYYAIISMPVFTINLLSGIVYRPRLLHMAEAWNVDNKEEFRKLVWVQIRNIILISIMIIGGGITIGIKLLEILYGLSLRSLDKEFVVLLVGGGVVANYNFLSACLTIIRKQFFMLVISVIVMIIASVISNPIVQFWGLTGASYLYLILMMGEMISVFLILIVFMYKKD